MNRERMVHLETLTQNIVGLFVAFIILTLGVYLFMKVFYYKLSSLLHRILEGIVLESCLDH